MPSVPCYKCTEIAGIWKTFKWNPGSFGKSCRKFRIQDLKKLDTVFDLFVCHLKFITLPASGNDHQRAGAELLAFHPRHLRVSYMPTGYLYMEDN